MVAVLTDTVLPATLDPEPTATKLGRKFGARIDWSKVSDGNETKDQTVTIPGLNLEAMRKKADPEKAHAPKAKMCTFRVPLGIRTAQYQRLRDRALQRWIREQELEGWDWYRAGRIQVVPGVYPAVDLADGSKLLDQREFVARAWFQMREPKTVRIELPGTYFEPVVSAPEHVRRGLRLVD